MNGISPSTWRSAFGGVGAAASDTVGSRTAERDAAASERRTRYSPTNPGARARPATTAPPNRNRRRSSPTGIGGAASASSVGGTIGGSPARPRSHRYAHSAAAVPARDGTAATIPFSGRVTAANAPTTPSAISPMIPARGRRSDTIPSTTAAIVRTTPMPSSNAVLSSVPNVSIAKRFNHSGEPSTAAAPTARTGAVAVPIKPAARVAVPIAIAPDRTPIAAPTGHRTAGASPRADPIALLCLRIPQALRHGRAERFRPDLDRGRPHPGDDQQDD